MIDMTDEEKKICGVLRELQGALRQFAQTIDHANGVYNGIEIALAALTGAPPRPIPRPRSPKAAADGFSDEVIAEAQRILGGADANGD